VFDFATKELHYGEEDKKESESEEEKVVFALAST
jgi:hypothetical protein